MPIYNPKKQILEDKYEYIHIEKVQIAIHL